MEDSIYQAKKSFVLTHDGKRQFVYKGNTVREGHWLLDHAEPGAFEPLKVTFDVDRKLTKAEIKAQEEAEKARQEAEAAAIAEAQAVAAEQHRSDLQAKKREELDAIATEAGVEKPEDLPNKDAVVDAILAAETAAAEAPAG